MVLTKLYITLDYDYFSFWILNLEEKSNKNTNILFCISEDL